MPRAGGAALVHAALLGVMVVMLPACGGSGESQELARFHACVRKHHFGIASARATWLSNYTVPPGVIHWEMVTRKYTPPLRVAGRLILPPETADVAVLGLAADADTARNYAQQYALQVTGPGTAPNIGPVAGSADRLFWQFDFYDKADNKIIARCGRAAANASAFGTFQKLVDALERLYRAAG